VNLALSDEQQMLREAAINVLARHDTVGGARAARDGGEPVEIWPAAREAGWPGLLIDERHGGAGLDFFDAMLVLEQCGKRLAGIGLLGHLPATLVLARAAADGGERAAAELPALASGERRAAIVLARPPADEDDWAVEAGSSQGRWGDVPRAVADGGDADASVRVSGAAAFQADLDGADLIVVPVLLEGAGLRAALVDPAVAGVSIERQLRGDASRPLGSIELDGTEAVLLSAGAEALTEAWHLGQALLAADALGVAEAMLEMGVAYAKDRHAFGRPIGSYQAIKHQLVEILRRVDSARSLCFYVALAAEQQPHELALAAACARFAAEEAADYGTRTCIAVHGGIGATWEHDAPYYWRRAQLSRLLLGGATGAGERVAAEVIARARDSELADAVPVGDVVIKDGLAEVSA